MCVRVHVWILDTGGVKLVVMCPLWEAVEKTLSSSDLSGSIVCPRHKAQESLFGRDLFMFAPHKLILNVLSKVAGQQDSYYFSLLTVFEIVAALF